jgi:hypothetical protein
MAEIIEGLARCSDKLTHLLGHVNECIKVKGKVAPVLN